ncbi:Ig-like domain-containing protein [Dyadobacter sp. CY347]|uniref:Ig-like domain-containing protein n=1 Tax=Dyadobacter sp. CY347 TaxID=2909336 RepID=UPI001F2BE19E|nr:Ig-like domain-containing protein [Dyadobacter sp. CY347]MCF2488577.1 Ig-like domain-containing protein [Dyadobacter sp. CY347]
MKNFYLYLTGLVLLVSGIEMADRLVADSNPKEQLALSQKNRVHVTEAAPVKIPFVRPRAITAGSKMMLVPGISATNSYVISNDTGLSGGSAGDEITYAVTISNGGTDATGVVFSETLDENTTLVQGSVTASPIAVNDSYNTIGNVGLTIPAGIGLLSNDVSPDGAALTITSSATVTTTQGGTVTLDQISGEFTYDAPAGYTGSDTFEYTIGNNSGTTSTATATITATGAIWFIKADAPAGGTGTLSKPFNSLNAFQSINNNTGLNAKTGHLIFIYTGSYDGSITLLASQKLIGQGAGESILSLGGFATPSGGDLLPATGGTRPTVTSSGTAVTLAADNTIRGFNIGNTTGSKLAGTFTGTLTVREMALNGSGRAMAVSGGTFDAVFSEVSSSSTTGGESVTIGAGSGSVTIPTGTINATNAGAIKISGSSLALNVTFVSVSSSGTSKGVSVSGTTGTFQITGSGTTDGSGGIIQNISGRGMEFISAAGITIKNVNMVNANTTDGTLPSALDNSNANAAIHANSVAGLSLDNVEITGTVSQEGINLRGVSNFNFTNGTIANGGTLGTSEEGCIYAINTSGTCTITNSAFVNPGGRAVYFDNTNTNLSKLTVSGSSFDNADNGSGLQTYARGSSAMNLRVINSQFTRCRTAGIESYATDNAVIQADVLDCIINPTDNVGTGIDIASSGSATAKFNVSNNTVSTWNGPALNFFTTGNGSLEGNVTANNLTKTAQAGSGIRVSNNTPSASSTVLIRDNVINNWSTGNGIAVEATSSTNTLSNVTIDNNTMAMTGVDALYGIDVLTAGGGTNNAKICANIINNDVTISPVVTYAARARSGVAGSTEIRLQGIGTTFEETWNNGGNSPGAGPVNQSGSGPFTIGAGVICTVPSVPLLNARMSAEEQETAKITPEENPPAALRESAENVPATKPVVQMAPAVKASPARMEAAQAGETVTINGGGSGFNIPAGKNVIITFRAIINSDIPTAVCQVSTQGTVSGSNFDNVLTDDPAVAGSNNPTVTPVVSVPVITSCPGDQTVSPDAGTCTSTQTLAATADACPAATIAYSVNGNPITFPYEFPAGATTVLVTASNGIGTAPTCSFTVTVTPTPAPPITDEPDAQTICAGADASFTVATSQGDVTYQWQKKPSGGAYADIDVASNPTADDATLTLTNVPATDNQSEYRCIVSNPCNSSTSEAAILTVNEITSSSLTGTTSVNQGAAAPVVTFGATGGTLPYTFTYTVNGGSNQTVSTTGTETTATLSQPTDVVGVFNYELVSVTDALSCSLTPSSAQTAVVTVANDLTATISGTESVCQNATQPVITFTAVNGIAPFTFTYNIDGGTDQTVSTTGTSTTATVNAPTSATGTFVYNLTNVSGAGDATTPVAAQTVTITVNAAPTIALTGEQYECTVDLNSYTVFFTASDGAVITSDKGVVSGNTVTGIPTNETAILTATLGTCSTTLSVSKDCSLPVTLIDFNGSNVENTAVLTWRTAEETNSERFDIQRSTDGKDWRTVGTEKSHGESYVVKSYSFVDKTPGVGDNFYRLKMIDLDKTFAYSRVIQVRLANHVLNSEFYPNPVSDVLTLSSTNWNEVKSVEIHNMIGNSVYRSGEKVSKTISVKEFPVGMYILTITHSNGDTVSRKVLISH